METRALFKKRCHKRCIGRAAATIILAVLAVAGIGIHSISAAPAPDTGWFVDMKVYSQSAHTGMSCQECHGAMDATHDPHPDPADPEYLKTDFRERFDYGKCKSCHLKSHERSQSGEHANALLKAADPKQRKTMAFDAPNCGHCHSAHYAKSHQSRVETGRQMVETCGACHPEQKHTYLENYHGKAAVNLANDRAAYCTDCHGAHDVATLKEDKALVLATCQRCHPEAPPAYADIVIHNTIETVDQKAGYKKELISKIHIAGMISFIFVTGVIVFFYTHSFLLLVRKIHEKLRKHE